MHSVSLTLSLIIAQRAFYATLNTHQYPHWWPFNVAHHIEHHQDFKLVTCPISGGPFGWTRKLPDSVIPANFRNKHTAQSGARQSASEEAPRWCHIHPHQGKAGLLVCSHFTARPNLRHCIASALLLHRTTHPFISVPHSRWAQPHHPCRLLYRPSSFALGPPD